MQECNSRQSKLKLYSYYRIRNKVFICYVLSGWSMLPKNAQSIIGLAIFIYGAIALGNAKHALRRAARCSVAKRQPVIYESPDQMTTLHQCWRWSLELLGNFTIDIASSEPVDIENIERASRYFTDPVII